MTSSLKLFISVYKLLCVCSVIDHRGRQNVVRTSVTHSAAPRVPLFCSYHILTSSVIYYWTDAWQLGIYLLNFYYTSIFVAFPFLKIGDDDNTQVDCQTFCSWAKQNCPRVFDGIHCWMRKMLLQRGNSAAAATPEVATVIYCYLLGGGSVVGVVRVMFLKSHGPRFKPSILPFLWFVLGCPEFNSLAALCVKPTDLPSASCYF